MRDDSTPAFPPLTDEDRAFLRAILEIPEDGTTWLVYADWLDDRGDPRGEFVRLLMERAALPADAPGRAAVEARLAELRPALDPRWVAAFDPAPVVVCAEWPTGFPCARGWLDMAPTDAPDIRICRGCRRPVFYAVTAAEAEQIGSLGEGVALTTAVPPEDNPFREPALPPDEEGDDGIWYPPAVAPPEPAARPWWKFW